MGEGAALCFRVNPLRTFNVVLEGGRTGASGEAYAIDRGGKLLSPSRFEAELVETGLLEAGASSIFSVEARVPDERRSHGRVRLSLSPTAPLTRLARACLDNPEAAAHLEGQPDYRGVRVVGASQWLPALDLGLVVKRDEDEAWASFRFARDTIAALGGITVLLLGVEPRGYGHWTVPKVEMYWEPNQAFMVGGGFARTAWGFRKYPWANMQSLTVLYSTGYNAVRASNSGLWRLNDASLLASLRLLGSGAENMNFFGFGNDTPDIPEKSLYKTEVDQYSVFPALGYAPSRSFEIHIGAEAKVVQPKGGDSLVEQEQAYGTGDFGEVGVRAGFEYDSRGRAMGMTAQRAITAPGDSGPVGPSVNGVRILAETFFVPKAWDVTDDFGGAEGSVATYLGNQKITFATRVGGRKVWGPYPWFESASIGGSGSVRGYDGGRFRGDASLFGNAELRFWLGHRKKAALPLRWGLTAFVDSGRVWYDDEDSKKWHTGYGGGLVTQLLGTPLALQAAIASGTEGIHVYFKGGYSF